MATTTNYGWTTPDDTSLVKDGASAIRTLGSAIDTSLNTALGTKKAGLVLLNTTSFSAVASQAINSVFNSTYDNYKVMIDINTASSDASLTFRLRVSGTDAATNYDWAVYGWNLGTNVVAGARVLADTSLFAAEVDTAVSGHQSSIVWDITSPNKADRTNFIGSAYYYQTGGQKITLAINGQHTTQTAYDGFNLIASAGNITGTVSVYGYNK